ncbi:MAG: peptidase [Candidatus Omnitrophica bacterium]|nr:peptidase [Candidatus Omnitrophota bacterium]
MFGLKLRMYLLTIILFAIVYAIVSMLSYSVFGIGDFSFYLILSLVFMFIQYMVGPKLVEWSMRIRYVSEKDYPQLHQMVAELAQRARMPKPKVGIAGISLPNAFAYGRWKSDGRICVTEGILNLLSPDELRAVLGHEMSHLKNRDVLFITLLSVVPIILYRIFWGLMFSRGSRRSDSGYVALLGLAALIFYFITNLLVLYASRIREYFADRGSVALGNPSHQLATALYKLVYGSARMPKESLRQVEGLKAFFLNDPSRGLKELHELKQLDLDRSGSIDANELLAIRTKVVKLSFGDKVLELMSTHPNMLKRIKRLSDSELL